MMKKFIQNNGQMEYLRGSICKISLNSLKQKIKNFQLNIKKKKKKEVLYKKEFCNWKKVQDYGL